MWRQSDNLTEALTVLAYFLLDISETKTSGLFFFLRAHSSFTRRYDDILIKAISHIVVTVIKNIRTHRGFISAPHLDGRMEDEKMMNAETHSNELHCSSG